MGRVLTLETVGLFKLDGFLNLLRVGLISTLYLPCRRRGATTAVGSSGWAIDERRSGERGTIDRRSTHVLINRYYNGWIRCDVAASDGAIAWSADHRIRSEARALNRSVITATI